MTWRACEAAGRWGVWGVWGVWDGAGGRSGGVVRRATACQTVGGGKAVGYRRSGEGGGRGEEKGWSYWNGEKW